MWALVVTLASGGVLPWIHDNYPEAKEKALAAGKPIVVDLWAPWCHTCLSMQQTVLADPALADVADQFIWLAMDTDREVNFAAVETLKPGAWPTFYVVDPAGAVLARHVGSASPAEWRAFLAAGKAADGASVALRAAEAAAATGDNETALHRYEEALAALPADHPRRDIVRVGRLGLLWKLQRFPECARTGLKELPTLASASATAADYTWYAFDCAAQTKDAAVAQQLRQAVLGPASALRRLLANPAALTTDDHSDALRILREVLDADGRNDEARKVAESQMDLLTKAHEAAPTPTGRMTFGYPLAEVAGFLGRGAEVVPLLEATERDLPTEYDPPYRLAGVLLKLGRLDDALAAAKRAEARIYGPRKGRALALIAQIQAARKDTAGEKAAWQAVVALMDNLPESQRIASLVEQARAALAR